MDTKLRDDRFEKFRLACNQMDAVPEVLFSRCILGGRDTLMMFSGPRLDMEKLKKLRAQINEVLDAKERQLNGKIDPNTINVSF